MWPISMRVVTCYKQLYFQAKHRMASFVVHHKVSGSNISRTVWLRITKFHRYIHTDMLYSHTGYDVTSYFRSPFIEVRKTTENVASDGFGSNFSTRKWFSCLNFSVTRFTCPTNWWASCFKPPTILGILSCSTVHVNQSIFDRSMPSSPLLAHRPPIWFPPDILVLSQPLQLSPAVSRFFDVCFQIAAPRTSRSSSFPFSLWIPG